MSGAPEPRGEVVVVDDDEDTDVAEVHEKKAQPSTTPLRQQASHGAPTTSPHWNKSATAELHDAGGKAVTAQFQPRDQYLGSAIYEHGVLQIQSLGTDTIQKAKQIAVRANIPVATSTSQVWSTLPPKSLLQQQSAAVDLTSAPKQSLLLGLRPRPDPFGAALKNSNHMKIDNALGLPRSLKDCLSGLDVPVCSMPLSSLHHTNAPGDSHAHHRANTAMMTPRAQSKQPPHSGTSLRKNTKSTRTSSAIAPESFYRTNPKSTRARTAPDDIEDDDGMSGSMDDLPYFEMSVADNLDMGRRRL